MRTNTTIAFLKSCFLFVLMAIALAFRANCETLTPSSNPTELRAYAQEIKALKSPSAEQLFSLANTYFWLKDYDSAEKTVSRAIDLQPRSAVFFAFRGLMRKHLEQYKLASNDMDKAEALGYQKPNFFADRSRVRLILKDYSGASTDAEKYLHENPNNAVILYVKGRAECELNRTEKGIEYLSKAIELNPKDANFIQSRGWAYQRLGRTKEAQADFASAKGLGLKLPSATSWE